MQGLTEFLPISSSGHLLLAEHFLGLPVADLKAFDVILHAGTLAALLIIFVSEVWGMLQAGCQLVIGHCPEQTRTERNLLFNLVIATIPAALLGFFGHALLDEFTRGEERVFWVACFLLLTALALFLAEKINSWRQDLHNSQPNFLNLRQKFGLKLPQSQLENLTKKQAFWIGCWQALALLPGVSRSGATIVAGMLTGLTRESAARFSFLMLMPATAGATMLTFLQFQNGEVVLPNFTVLSVGFLASFFTSGLVAVTFLRLIKKYSLTFFSWYLVIIGGLLLLIQ